MKRPWLAYLLAVVVPSAAVVGLCLVASAEAGRALQAGSQARAGRMALSILEQDVGRTADSLGAVAAPMAGADPADPMVQRAIAGEPVTGLTSVDGSVEVSVLVGPRPEDERGAVRFATAPLSRSAIDVVGTATGYGIAVYLNGQVWAATDPPAGPAELDPAALAAVDAAPDGTPAPRTGDILVGLEGGARSSAVVALVAASGARPSPVPRTWALVAGLLLLFAALAGWIQLSGHPPAPGSFLSLVLLSLVPALTACGFAVQTGRALDAAARDLARRDLTSALAVARMRDAVGSVTTVRDLTGFHVTRVAEGAAVETTYPTPVPAIGELPGPPGSFTSAGTVATPDGPSEYVALRVDRSSHLVVTASLGAAALEAFARQSWAGAGALTVWLALLAGLLVARRRRPGGAPA